MMQPDGSYVVTDGDITIRFSKGAMDAAREFMKDYKPPVFTNFGMFCPGQGLVMNQGIIINKNNNMSQTPGKVFHGDSPVPFPEQETERNLTFGEKAVGLTFNPSNNLVVDQVKREAAALINTLNKIRKESLSSDVQRMASIAITDVQTAQMWGVKAVTWKD